MKTRLNTGEGEWYWLSGSSASQAVVIIYILSSYLRANLLYLSIILYPVNIVALFHSLAWQVHLNLVYSPCLGLTVFHVCYLLNDYISKAICPFKKGNKKGKVPNFRIWVESGQRICKYLDLMVGDCFCMLCSIIPYTIIPVPGFFFNPEMHRQGRLSSPSITFFVADAPMKKTI